MRGDLTLVNIGELVTNAPGAADLVGAIADAAVVIRDGFIVWAGAEVEFPDHYRDLGRIDCEGRAVVPGFVDAHTHVVFAGDRADEFARRLDGETYEEVLASGGGIRATVTATRTASDDELATASRRRLDRMLANGTTTAESKSGYGLDVDTERRQLQVSARLDAEHAIDLVPTFLGAHHTPAAFADDPDDYLGLVIEEALPVCAPLARFADVFCDVGAFTVEQARRVLLAAREHGLDIRLHADELDHSGGARLAADLRAASADHLAYVSAEDAAAMAEADVAAVLLPSTTLSLRSQRFAPGRMLWDAGVTVALGTDCNPGTSYVESMPFVVALACLRNGLRPAEALWAGTRGSALSLLLDDRGTVTPGAVGDLVVLDLPSYRDIPYRLGLDVVWKTVKRGNVVFETA